MPRQTTHDRDLALRHAVTELNVLQGYSNRYRLITSFERRTGEPRAIALVKAVGPQDLNVSGWRHPDAMLGFIAGFREGYVTADRRALRKATQ